MGDTELSVDDIINALKETIADQAHIIAVLKTALKAAQDDKVE